MSDWQRLREIVRIDSDWVRLIAERWLCDKGQELEYWRVEKVDSVIVLPLYRQQLLCVRPSFRPGIQRATLDFPGGRLPAGQQPLELAPLLLERELGVPPTALQRTEPLNHAPSVINSAFSNQGLWGIVAEIDPNHPLPATHIGQRAPATVTGMRELLQALDDLQCRAVLLEWARAQGGVPADGTPTQSAPAQALGTWVRLRTLGAIGAPDSEVGCLIARHRLLHPGECPCG
ncbi:NUDIX hydrolase [Halochromatium roseum]|uniref:NUDIX hydrolase n=1 Tax=Halochromatium roseum TaxID=391920 RepID=UPI00191175DB|nr:NUDIX hydrolase [Halochromatium roseum]